jgi:hypothetical protein
LEDGFIEQKRSLGLVQRQQNEHTGTLQEILNAVRGAPAAAGGVPERYPVPYVPPPPGGHAPPPPPALAGGGAIGAGHGPPGAEFVTLQMHNRFCVKFAIDRNRADQLPVFNEFTANPVQQVALAAYGTRMMRAKNMTQWRAKLTSAAVGGDGAAVAALHDLTSVFDFIKANFWAELHLP